MPAEAITALEVRELVEKFPDLTLPETVSDPMLERVIRRKTALVMAHAGLSSLPSSSSQQRELLNNFVASLTLIEVRRSLFASNPEILRALGDEEKRVIADMSVLEDTSASAGYRFDVVGGAEESSSD